MGHVPVGEGAVVGRVLAHGRNLRWAHREQTNGSSVDCYLVRRVELWGVERGRTHPDAVLEFNAANLNGLEQKRDVIALRRARRGVLCGREVRDTRSGRVLDEGCHRWSVCRKDLLWEDSERVLPRAQLL